MSPTPKPRFEPNLRDIQTKIDQVTSELEKQLNDNTKGEALMHRVIEVCHVKSEEKPQVTMMVRVTLVVHMQLVQIPPAS